MAVLTTGFSVTGVMVGGMTGVGVLEPETIKDVRNGSVTRAVRDLPPVGQHSGVVVPRLVREVGVGDEEDSEASRDGQQQISSMKRLKYQSW